MALVLGNAAGNIVSPEGSLGKIEDQEGSKDLLKYKIGLFGVEMDEAHSIFQAAEGGLNAPAPGIKLFQFGKREFVLGQIREERNHRAVIPFQTDDLER